MDRLECGCLSDHPIKNATRDEATQGGDALTQDCPAPSSLCLIRLSALGDVCHAVPMVRALQAAWPETSITWVIGKKEAPLVAHLPNIRFVVFDKSNNLSSFRQIKKQLAHERFDVLVLAQTSIRANLLSLAIRARRRVGFSGTHAPEGHGLFVSESVELPDQTHQAEAVFAFAPYLLKKTDLSLDQIDRGLPIPENARAFALTHQPEAKHAVLVSPCSSHSLRNWSAASYAQVCDWIIEHGQRPVILIGGPSEIEKDMGRSIEAAMHQTATNLIGKDTLHQAMAMLERARCLISPDSGPAHMADGLGTPVIGLYAATRPARSGPWASIDHCVDGFDQAAIQYRGKPADALKWAAHIETAGVMDVITPQQVIEKLKVVLG